MASSGPLYPGTVATEFYPGQEFDSSDWIDPTGIGGSGGVYATVEDLGADGNRYTYLLKATNFGFSIPAGATILGVVAEIARAGTTNTSTVDDTVKIIKGGTIQGDNKSTGDSVPAGPPTWETNTYGGASDLWGLSLTPSDINASNFGIVYAGHNIVENLERISVDFIRVTVYYLEAGQVMMVSN